MTNTIYMIFVLCINPFQLGLKKKKGEKKAVPAGQGPSKLVWNEKKKNPSVPGILIVILSSVGIKSSCLRAGGKREALF